MNTRKTLVIASALVAASLAPLALLADPLDPADAPGASVAEHASHAIASVAEVHVAAEVMAVDPLTHNVRLREPTRIVDLRVQDPEQLKRVAVGDQVEATYTEAVAISVEPAGAPR